MKYLRWLRCHVLSLHRDALEHAECAFANCECGAFIWRCADCGVVVYGD